MTAYHTTADVDWSLWTVPGIGELLITEDERGVLIQVVDVTYQDGSVVAFSRSLSGRRTIIEGKGGHGDRFETALVSHLEIFEIERDKAERIDIEDLIPVGSTAVTARM